MGIGPVEDHRKREKGLLVYPVYSRRSGGLSVGINLFPDRKSCSFDCPYCEVFPFENEFGFSLPLMETALAEAIANAKGQGIPVRDICFSGNGEPTLSPDFPAAMEAAFRIRDKEVPDAELVLITNAAGLLDERIFELLRLAANRENGLRIWLKLDAGTPEWYRAMNRSAIPYERLIRQIQAFAKCAPFVLQTMICAVDGMAPPAGEARAWEALVMKLAMTHPRGLRGIQIYGKARPAPRDPLAAALPNEFLDKRAVSLKMGLAAEKIDILVDVYY